MTVELKNLPEAVMSTDLPLGGRRQGKVRDIYQTRIEQNGEAVDAIVMVATDRISAFDVVMPEGVPGRGIVLTQISRFWFDMIAERFGDRLSHHVISTDAADIPNLDEKSQQMLDRRVTLGRQTDPVPIECVVRGYLAGSGWKEYQKSGTVCGISLPAGLSQCEKLPSPIFTPATKAQTGHDENISFERACEIAGEDVMTMLRDLSLEIYQMGHDHARDRGIVLADTKFEFGRTDDGALILIDEVLTPDSSRFWPANQYEPGRDQESYDKQYVRNYLEELVEKGRWDKTPPGPSLPKEIVRNTLRKYLEAYQALTGEELKF